VIFDLNAEGQRSLITHFEHFGFLAVQTRLPCSVIELDHMIQSFLGTISTISFSILSAFVCFVKPSRAVTRV